MVSVAADYLPCVLVYKFAEARVFVPVLPAGRRHDDEQAQFVASVHESRVHGVVGRAYDGHACVFQSLGVAPLLAVWHGVANVGKVLMAVAADELVVRFPVQPEAVVALELGFAHAHAHSAAVNGFAVLADGYFNII